MKKLVLLGLLIPTLGFAQQYSIDWYKIAGGGGTSTGGTYQVSGTIGQQDAGGPMTGGNYSLTGGFWSLIAAVQTAGAPLLAISRSGGSVIVSWPISSTNWILQQNSKAVASNWAASPYTVSTNGGSNSITINPPSGNLFFRLMYP
jgi:hypothetical protein